MITPAYLQRMARYNRWQNESLYGAADGLTEDARRADRGSFFQSIHGTLSHILWADQIWMSRLSDWDKPEVGISNSAALYDAWDDLKTWRKKADATFITWADGLSPSDTQGDLS
ncbi:MAG: DinB family protein, partial [Pseudomonadota bacterium]